MKITFEYQTSLFELDLLPSGKSYRAVIGDKTLDVEAVKVQDGKLELLIDGNRFTAYVSTDHDQRWVTVAGQTFLLTKSAGRGGRSHGQHHAAGELTAPMPGQIRAVSVSEGENVVKGQTLLVLEAMKMEIRVQAPFDGKVSSISVRAGQIVEREQVLVKMDHE